MNKNQKIRLIKTISFWSYKRERIKNMHLMSDYKLYKIALKKFNKQQVREIIKEDL